MEHEQPWVQQLWEMANESRNHDGGGRFRHAVNWLQKLESRPSLDQVPEIADRLAQCLGDQFGSGLVPPSVIHFVEEYLKGINVSSVMDPSAGFGSLIASAQSATGAGRVVACEIWPEAQQLGTLLNPSCEWHLGDFLTFRTALQERFDLVVSVLPFSARSNRQSNRISRDLGFEILVESSTLLNDDGIGIFVTTPGFLWRSESPLHRLSEWGLGIEAALALPPGAFAPYTSIPTFLVIIRRTESSRMFVGQLTNSAPSQQSLVANLKAGTEAETVDQGRFVDPKSFTSLETLRIEEQIAAVERGFGSWAVHLTEIMIHSVSGKRDELFEFPKTDNAIFIPTVGRSDVVDSVEDLKLKPQNYLQVAIDPEKSNARFVARFLNTELGYLIREASKRGSTIGHITNSSIKTIKVSIPPIDVQQQLIELDNRIAAERNTLNELQGQLITMQRTLWSTPNEASLVEQRLREFSSKLSIALREEANQGVKVWIETQPFPLASILHEWRNAPSQDFKTKYEHLLHFFEATTALNAIILLSAFGLDKDELRAGIERGIEKSHGSIAHPRFGTWRIIYENLTARVRKMLEDDESARKCGEIFADESLAFPTALSAPGLGRVFVEANRIRNKTKGHGGVIGRSVARGWHESLTTLLNEYRECTVSQWSAVELVKADGIQPRRNHIDIELLALMGSHSGFERENRRMQALLNLDSLYILNRNGDEHIQLIDLMKLGASPENAINAFYFFNGVEKEGFDFVSYHYAPHPRVSVPASEPLATLEALTGGWFSSVRRY